MSGKETRRPRGRPVKSQVSGSSLIIDAAMTSFASQGFKATSLRQVAAKAGVDAALISHTFGSKLGLWQAVIDHVAKQVLATALPVSLNTVGKKSPVERLCEAIGHLVDIMFDAPHFAQFAVREISQQNEQFEYVFAQIAKPFHDLLLPLIREAQEAGEIDGVDPNILFFVLTGSVSMSISVRPFVARFSPAVANSDVFRRELKRSLCLMLGWRQSAGPVVKQVERKNNRKITAAKGVVAA